MNQLVSIGVSTNGVPPFVGKPVLQPNRLCMIRLWSSNQPNPLPKYAVTEDFPKLMYQAFFEVHYVSSSKIMLHLVNLPSMKTRAAILQAQYLFRSTRLPHDTLLAQLLPFIQCSTKQSHWYKLSRS